jgi:hypothetical protein
MRKYIVSCDITIDMETSNKENDVESVGSKRKNTATGFGPSAKTENNLFGYYIPG